MPSDVFAACHNSDDNVTISGPPGSVAKFVESLVKDGIFAKAVKSSSFAFHSKYVADAGSIYRDYLEMIITAPRVRTSRWLSTSIPESNWNTPIAQHNSADYHVNNFLSPVLFHDAIRKIPKNAVCIEIAPTGLLQAILRRSLGNAAISLSLMKRGHPSNVEYLLENIGK